jgi:Kef-type K+ transport system membrane component KefB/voltage-gated potassium channel Kch
MPDVWMLIAGGGAWPAQMLAPTLAPTLAQTGATEQPLAVVLVVILSAAALVAVASRRLGIEAIPGYLLAGAAIGPSSLGLVTNASAAQGVTQLSTVLLLFTIGLQFDAAAFKRGALSIIAISIASTLLYLALFAGVLAAAGLSAPVALALAMAGCSASTAVTLRLLQQRRELQAAHGRVSMGFSILDDLSGVVMLATFPLVAAWAAAGAAQAGAASGDAGGASWGQMTLAAVKALGGVAAMLVLGRVLLPRLMVRIAALGSPEVLLVCAAAVALLSAVWTSWIGFSPEMGAFLAGFMLAGTPLRYQLVGQLAPTRDLLMAVFFVAVGLVIDPGAVARDLPAVLGLAAALMVIKLVTTGGCAWAGGMTPRASMLTGVYNINAGEFTFVLLAAASELAIITEQQAGLGIAVAMITLMATPPLIGPAHALGIRMARWPLAPWQGSASLRDPATPAGAGGAGGAGGTVASGAGGGGGGGDAAGALVAAAGAAVDPAAPLKPRSVIIAGFGPGGRAVADRLDIAGVPYVIVDLNAASLERQAKVGRRVVFGDIANPEVLEAAGLAVADAVIVTFPDDEAALRAVQAVRAASPSIFIGVRMQYLSGQMQALALGADEVAVAEVAIAVSLEKNLMRGLDDYMARRHAAALAAARSGDAQA